MQDFETRKLILSSIKRSGITVSFTKKDGTDREMLCTLAESLIPSDKRPKTENTKFSDDALRVFDLDKQEWRSFRWDSIKTVKGI
jgi:hypothetical protein